MSVSGGVSYVPLVNPIEVTLGGLSAYALNNLDGTDPMYIGKANNAGGWVVQKYTSAGDMTYANKSNNAAFSGYSDAWAGRAGLAYTRYELLTGI
jgi:hypothetical protein